MRVVVCAMAKNEHLYINEWVEHYVNLGVDTIYIYDNDDLKSEYIGNYINSKYAENVVIKNVRGLKREHLQNDVYTAFYNKYGTTFDYCLFCDIDEFLDGVSDIKTWLSTLKAPQIRIKWRLFGDDDTIKRDMNIKVKDFFKKEVKSSLNRNLIDKGDLEIQGKFILKGGLKDTWFYSVHYCKSRVTRKVYPSLLPSGKPCNSGVRIREDYSQETIYLNHYMTKTLDEFINQKLNRNDAVFNQKLKVDYFWRINKKTQEKLDYLKEKGLI